MKKGNTQHKTLEEAIMELYLSVKIRKQEEVKSNSNSVDRKLRWKCTRKGKGQTAKGESFHYYWIHQVFHRNSDRLESAGKVAGKRHPQGGFFRSLHIWWWYQRIWKTAEETRVWY